MRDSDYMNRRDFSLPLVPFYYGSWMWNHGLPYEQIWDFFGMDLNPMRDANLEYMLLKQFAMRRMRLSRGATFRPLYWNHLPQSDQIVAGAEESLYLDSEIHMRSAATRYIHENYIAKDDSIFQFSNDELVDRILLFHKARPEADRYYAQLVEHQSAHGKVVTESDVAEMSDYYDLHSILLPPDDGVATVDYTQRLNSQTLVGSVDPILPLPVLNQQATSLRRWRDNGANLQAEIYAASFCFVNQLQQAWFESNQIKGTTRHSECLLINESIPLPTVETFLSWFPISVLSFRRFPQPLRNGQFSYGAIITFVPPTLPEIASHRSNAALQNDSYTSHSLNPKSSAHRRVNGHIDLGERDVCSFLIPLKIDDPYACVTIESVNHSDVSGLQCVAHHEDMLSTHSTFREVRDTQIPFGPEWHRVITSWFFDPWYDSPTKLNVQWPLTYDMPYDSGYRGLSRTLRIHMRMDSDSPAQRRWVDAMLVAATEYLNMTPYERSVRLFRAMANISSRIGMSKPSGRGRATFDMSQLKL